MIELTVPWEEGCEEAHERKLTKYKELAETCRQKGWKTQLYVVEVGCRGFTARSVGRFLKDSGIVGNQLQTAIRNLGEAAERASIWLRFKRNNQCWKPVQEEQWSYFLAGPPICH